jgi:hypothetical protein
MTEWGGEVPVANATGGTIIRCKRCRTYINPFMAWMDGGRWATRGGRACATPSSRAALAGRPPSLSPVCAARITCTYPPARAPPPPHCPNPHFPGATHATCARW